MDDSLVGQKNFLVAGGTVNHLPLHVPGKLQDLVAMRTMMEDHNPGDDVSAVAVRTVGRQSSQGIIRNETFAAFFACKENVGHGLGLDWPSYNFPAK
jgi:hypothetical protein